MSNSTMMSGSASIGHLEEDSAKGLPQKSADRQEETMRPIIASRASQITITPSTLHIRSLKSPISPTPNLRSPSVNVPERTILENPEGVSKRLTEDMLSEAPTRIVTLTGPPSKASVSEEDSSAQESSPDPAALNSIKQERSPTIVGDRGNEEATHRNKPTVFIPPAGASQLVVQRPTSQMKRQDSITSLKSTRPAPFSPASSHPSNRSTPSKHDSVYPHSTPRRQSLVSQTTTERSPSHKGSTSSLRQLSGSPLRKSFSKQSASGHLSISSSRRQSSLAISFTAGNTDQSSSIVSPAFSKLASPLSAIERSAQTPDTPSQMDTISESQLQGREPSNELIDELTLRRNLSSTSASTSGDSSSTNPATRHANELEAAYSSFGLYSLSPVNTKGVATVSNPIDTQETLEHVQDQAGSVTEQSDAWDAEEWSKVHPILVRDFAFEEDDERFSKRPPELLLSSERKAEHPRLQKQTRRSSHRGGLSPRGQLRAAVGGFGYGTMQDRKWDPASQDEEEEEWEDLDDGWGFPMGTISGGAAPLGTTAGTRRSELKNKQRAWKNLGSQGIGGRYVDLSEGESSGFYEESGEDDDHDQNQNYDEDEPGDEWEKPDNPLDPRTPSYSYAQSPNFYNPELDPLDGVEGDDDDSPQTLSPVAPAPLYSGIYRALYSFQAEGSNEMNLKEGQLVRILGRGGGDGWVVALRHWTIEELIKGTREDDSETGDDEETQGLVPESYLQVYRLDDIP